MLVIVGLGNFGDKYAKTRHNVGFMTVDAIARKKGIVSWKRECKGLTAAFFEGGQKIMLVKPQTYMNLSGECVGALCDYYDIDPEDIVVIYDDVDLPPGMLRVRKKGGPGTHNGMRSVVMHLATTDFPRIRIGIGKAPPRWDLADYVLAGLSEADQKLFAEACEKAADAALSIADTGIEATMNQVNRQERKEKENEKGGNA